MYEHMYILESSGALRAPLILSDRYTGALSPPLHPKRICNKFFVNWDSSSTQASRLSRVRLYQMGSKLPHSIQFPPIILTGQCTSMSHTCYFYIFTPWYL